MRARYSGDSLAGFLGSFYAISSLATLLFQAFFVHHILKRGVFTALALLPACLLAACAGVAATGAFGWIVAAKLMDPVLDFTINATGIQLLYLGIRKQTRSQARAFAEGIGRPLAMAGTGLLLLAGLRALSPRMLALTIVGVGAAWILLAWRSYRGYIGGLLESIGARRFDLAEEAVGLRDPRIEERLREGLRSARDEDVPYLLGVIPELADAGWLAEHRMLLERESPVIKAAALDYLRRHAGPEDSESILAHLEHSEPAVRRAALEAAAARVGAPAIDRMRPLLEDPDFEVRGAATAALINMGDLEALLIACISLQLMLYSREKAGRVAAAAALARIRNAGLSRPLTALLEDSDPEVRLAALDACRHRPTEDLIPAVLSLLDDSRVAIEAAAALPAFGPSVAERLANFPERALREPVPDSLFLVPGILADLGTARAAELLRPALATPNVPLRSEVIAALARIVAGGLDSAANRGAVEEAARASIQQAAHREELAAELDEFPAARILCEVLREEERELLRAAFLGLEITHPGLEMKSVFESLTGSSPERRAGALEVLDNVLDPASKASLVSMFEGGRRKPTATKPRERLGELLSGEGSEWITAFALYTTGRETVTSSREAVRALLRHSSPFVRETALHAFGRLAEPEDLLAECRRMSEDSAQNVRALAATIAGAGSTEESGP